MRDHCDHHEKKDIKKEAEQLEAESRHQFHKHHQFAWGIACFQVGIVLASVSILVRIRAIYYLSLLAGVAWLIFAIPGAAGLGFRVSDARSSAERSPIEQEDDGHRHDRSSRRCLQGSSSLSPGHDGGAHG